MKPDGTYELEIDTARIRNLFGDVAGDPDAEERLLSYFAGVYKIASPTLLEQL